MEQIRSFIAVELPEELKKALARLQDGLKEGKTPVKWVDPAGIHLTLKFLGNISPGLVGRITAVLQEAAGEFAPFTLEAKGVGAFPGLDRPQVVWVGIGGEIERLAQLQQRVESSLKPLGFTPETRPFRAHLTLARVRDNARPEERRELGRRIANSGFGEAYAVPVTSVNLMKSQLTPRGAMYSCLGSAGLG